MESMNNKHIFIVIGVFAIFFLIAVYFIKFREQNTTFDESNRTFYVIENKTQENTNNTTVDSDNFDFKMIKKASEDQDNNFLISPLSMAYALSMARDGAENETYDEINKLLGNYELTKIKNVKDKIGLANAIFIKDSEKKLVKTTYINKLKENYDAEVIFDPFKSPDNINKWVENKTYKMIKKTLDQLTPDSLLVLVNTLAIDAEWQNKFESSDTNKKEFTFYNGINKKYTPMMYQMNGCSYIKSDNAKGIVKSYKEYEGTNLEYIAILPNGDIKEYIKNFNQNELDTLLENRKDPSSKLDIHLELPKYTYDYTYDSFAEDLMILGMQRSFTSAAQFDKISHDIYISKAIHKTHIELSESGTKAAAVTALVMDKNAAYYMDEKQQINITFDKPFIYIIKDKNSSNIWFFGVVYEPMNWEDNKSK